MIQKKNLSVTSDFAMCICIHVAVHFRNAWTHGGEYTLQNRVRKLQYT